MEREMTVTEAPRHFADVVARAFYRGESATLIKNGRAVARIVPVEKAVLFPTWAELAKRWTDRERSRLSPAQARALEADLKAAGGWYLRFSLSHRDVAESACTG